MIEVYRISKDGQYRLFYDGSDMGMKWRIQRKENNHWTSIVWFGTAGEAFSYWEKAGHEKRL